MVDSIVQAICETDHAWLTEDARSGATAVIIGTLGLALAGSSCPLAGEIIAAISPRTGPSTIFGGDRGVAAIDAAYLNAVAARTPTESEETIAWLDRSAVPMVTALLSLGEARQTDGGRLVEAVCAGLLALDRLVAASEAVAVAGGCARMLNLDADRVANALKLAAALQPSCPVAPNPVLVSLRAGEAARAGLLAASLAAGDVISDLALADVLPGSRVPVPPPSPSSLFGWFEHVTACVLPADNVAILFERLETIDAAANLADIGRLLQTGAKTPSPGSVFSRVDLAVADYLVETQWVP
ncbi:MmgE/PrpD family protein [Mesorhizobium sp. 1B3]|uniref:MmgE/PrpD family protein n=1 Tax=Mesorhizobium sp. 1B3 TaxID=3243599 RepID=UPI003D9811E1